MALPLEIGCALGGAGLLCGGKFTVLPLAGGVSCDIWRVEEDGRQFAVKRAHALFFQMPGNFVTNNYITVQLDPVSGQCRTFQP